MRSETRETEGDPILPAGREAAERLAQLVRIPTVSSYRREEEDDEAFRRLVDLLPSLWPRAAKALGREEIGDRALLYEWKGRNPALPAVILCAHFDVVPAGDEGAWSHSPFGGEIAEGYLWGRGTQDIKVLLAAILEAAEGLLAADFAPERSIYFAFGGDEEVGGKRGAARIAGRLAERGVRASFLLDEGGPVAKGLVSFAQRPIALVGISEKGYMDVLLEARGAGGHASMPPSKTAVGDIARAVAAIESARFPSRLSFTVRSFLARVAPYAPKAYRLLFRNLWLSAPLVKAAFSASPSTNALVRTTAAPTMIEGSPKENVLAERATANLNVRILPGDSSAGVLASIARRVAPFGVKARFASPEDVVEPLPEAPVDHEGFRALEGALATAFPEAAAAPFLFGAGTDTKHYLGVAEAIYRFTALEQDSADLEGIHAKDERVSIDNYSRCVSFYRSLMTSL